MTQSVWPAEYTYCISPDECPGYDTKQSDVEAPVMLKIWGNLELPLLCHHSRVNSDLEC